MTSGEVIVGLDLGTSGLKAVALDSQSGIVARAQCAYPTQRPEPGGAEQDPEHWKVATRQCVRELGEAVGADRIRAIGLSGMLPTLVTADRHGDAIGPALTWQDARAESQGLRLREAVGDFALYRRTGQWLDGRYLLSMYLRLAERDAPRIGRTVILLGAKDWLFGWLTGMPVTDPSTATGVGAYHLESRGWCDDVLAATTALGGRPMPGLPEVVPAETTVPLRVSSAAELGVTPGIPVCVGGADSVLGALGMDATTPGSVGYIAGTSTVVLGISHDVRPDPLHRYLITPLAGAPGWGFEMDLLATGSTVRWLAELFGLADEAAVLELAGTVDLEAAPTVLPFLAPGEQGALWDPQLTGAIVGLHLGSDRAQLARGVMSGIVLESRRCLSVLAERDIAGLITVAGGSANDATFRGDLADATGRAVIASQDNSVDYSALGAARLAASTIGAAFEIPQRALTAVHQPRPERGAVWDRLSHHADEYRRAIFPTT